MATVTLMLLFVFVFVFMDVVFPMSRYFVDERWQKNEIWPIDVCVAIPFNFILYQCNTTNPNEHVVIKYNHTIDYPNCDSPTPIITYHRSANIAPNPNNTDYELYSFNCVGEDNYYVHDNYFEDSHCHDVDAGNLNRSIYYHYYPYYFVTKLCRSFDGHYYKDECSGYFAAELHFDTLTECNNNAGSFYDFYYPSSKCGSFGPSKCMLNGTVIDEYTYSNTYIAENGTLPLAQRIGLVDIYFDIHLDLASSHTGHEWQYNTLCYSLWDNMEKWNLTQIWYDGNAFVSTGDVVLEDQYNAMFAAYGVTGRKSFCFLHTEYINNTHDNSTYLTVSLLLLNNFGSGNASTGQHASLPQTICNLTDLNAFYIIGIDSNIFGQGHFSFDGIIPECLWHLSELRKILMTGTHLESTIPDSICSGNIIDLQLNDNDMISGSIPRCLGDNNGFHNLVLKRMSKLTGTIPDNLLCSPYLEIIRIEGNYNLDSQEIPKCFSDTRRAIHTISIRDSHFIGTVPALPINIETEFGIITGATVLDLSDNRHLQGSIQDMFALYFQNHAAFLFLSVIHLSNGNFSDPDISIFLKHLFEAKQKKFYGIYGLSLSQVSLANNERIYGSLPDIAETVEFEYHTFAKNMFADLEYLFEDEEFTDYLTQNGMKGELSGSFDIPSVLLLHNCKLSGTLPSALKFKNLNMLTLFNNHLSGYIPADLTEFAAYPGAPSDRYYNMLLLGNSLWTDSDGLPEWINSPFSTAPTLYTSQREINERILIFVTAIIGFAVLAWITAQSQSFIRNIELLKVLFNVNVDDDDNDEYMAYFLNGFKLIQSALSDWRLCICIVAMFVFYPFNANYYDAVVFGTLFELSWYEAAAAQTWIDWALVVIAILYNYILLWVVYSLSKQIKLFKPKGTAIEMQQVQKLPKHSDSTHSSDGDPKLTALPTGWREIYTADGRVYYQNNTNKTTQWHRPVTAFEEAAFEEAELADDIDVDSHKKNGHKWWKLIIYFVLWIISMCFILIYIASKSLPAENVIGVTPTFTMIVTQSLALILLVNNQYIIPGFIGQLTIFPLVRKYQLQFRLIPQLINSIFLPFIASLFLLDECGKYWVNLWDYCTDYNLMSKFNLINYNLVIEDWQWILSANDVCSTPSISAMHFNECIRAFLYHWTGIIMLRIVYSILLQIPSLLYGILKQKCKPPMKIEMDNASVSIVMSLLTSLTFSFFAPFILLLILFDVAIKLFFFRLKHYKLKWEFVSKYMSKELLSFPVNFLFIGIGLTQLILVLFFIYCLGNKTMFVLFIVFIVVGDAVIIVLSLQILPKRLQRVFRK